MTEAIEKESLVIGNAYQLEARNLKIGIWTGRDFIGMREKWGEQYIDAERYFTDDRTDGTAKPVRELC